MNWEGQFRMDWSRLNSIAVWRKLGSELGKVERACRLSHGVIYDHIDPAIASWNGEVNVGLMRYTSEGFQVS